MYIVNKPASENTVFVGGIKKAELEKKVKHTVKSKHDYGNWIFLITIEDAVRLGLMTRELARTRYFEKTKMNPPKDYPFNINEAFGYVT